MKRIFNAIVFISISVWYSGCKKYLDIEPKGYLIPTTVEDYERILNANDLVYSTSDILERLADDLYDADLTKSNYQVTSSNQAYFWRADIYITDSDRNESLYNVFYKNIYQFNAVINEIDAASGGNMARKAVAKARAKAGRALCYWYLVNLYARPYQADNAAKDPGVSIVTGNDINITSPARASVQSTYDFIINDLTEAIPFLPVSVPDPYQLSKGAGYGILARTYLTMNNYAEASKAAQQVLDLNNRLVDYNAEYTIYNNKGLNFIYKKTGSLLVNNSKLPENIFVQYKYDSGNFTVSPLTEKLFAKDDLRRINFKPSSIHTKDPSNWNGIFIYGAYYTDGYSGDKNVGITTPEMYLIRAEANARAGNIQTALNDLNTLRKNRIKSETYSDLTAKGTIETVKLVLLERRKELLSTGARWFDMRRLNNDPDYGFIARHYFNDGTYIELAPNSLRYVLRLPEKAVNGLITQNP